MLLTVTPNHRQFFNICFDSTFQSKIKEKKFQCQIQRFQPHNTQNISQKAQTKFRNAKAFSHVKCTHTSIAEYSCSHIKIRQRLLSFLHFSQRYSISTIWYSE